MKNAGSYKSKVHPGISNEPQQSGFNTTWKMTLPEKLCEVKANSLDLAKAGKLCNRMREMDKMP